MARQKAAVISDYTAKNTENDDIPVAPCKGWTEPCEFCDKRFKTWQELSENCLESVPSKPGIFLVALRNKGVTETVDIAMANADIQKVAYDRMDAVKDMVADKKFKVTKSSILYRWMNYKSSSDKEVTTLLAHWHNLGVMPKFLKEWPGTNLLEESPNLMFSKKLNMWCYPKKDAVWKKTKAPPAKTVEVVQACDFSKPCAICDKNFSKWAPFEDTVQENSAPEKSGVFMISALCGKDREMVYLHEGSNDLRKQIELSTSHLKYSSFKLKEKYDKKNYVLQVRWMVATDLNNDNACLMYAHWLNAESLPMLNYVLLFEKILNKNKNFVMRTHDKKWCYVIDSFKQERIGKVKKKSQILDDLEDELNDLAC